MKERKNFFKKFKKIPKHIGYAGGRTHDNYGVNFKQNRNIYECPSRNLWQYEFSAVSPESREQGRFKRQSSRLLLCCTMGPKLF